VGVPIEQIVLGNNASLALMYDTIVFALLKGCATARSRGGTKRFRSCARCPGLTGTCDWREMKTAAKDFRIFWDNAYGVHHLTEESIGLANLMELCEAKGNANRAFVFASSSKITLAAAGISVVGSSKENVSWLLRQMFPQTIGSDKVNQLRHVMVLKDAAEINTLMAKHRALLAPKFEAC
jgi:hypothetical protein